MTIQTTKRWSEKNENTKLWWPSIGHPLYFIKKKTKKKQKKKQKKEKKNKKKRAELTKSSTDQRKMNKNSTNGRIQKLRWILPFFNFDRQRSPVTNVDSSIGHPLYLLKKKQKKN
jgi:hypothetical protein